MLDLEGSPAEPGTNPLGLALEEPRPFFVVFGKENRSPVLCELADRRRTDLLVGQWSAVGRLGHGEEFYLRP
jgi:hypothetical protein